MVKKERVFKTVERGAFITLGKSEDSDGKVITEVEGEVVEMDFVTFPNGTVGKYRLRGDDGVEFGLLGSVVLDDYFTDIEVGQYVRIQYTGTNRTGQGRETKDYLFQTA